MEKFWVFILDDGESWQTWGYFPEALEAYIREHSTYDRIVAIVSH